MGGARNDGVCPDADADDYQWRGDALISPAHRPPSFADAGDRPEYQTALVYGLVGLVPNQLFYFLAVQYGNAAIATILQFVGPFFIMLYMAVVHHERPSRLELISAVVAFFGVVVVATNGRFTHLALTIPVLVFGLLSAVGAMTDTLTPRPLMDRFGSLEITGWGLLIGGSVLTAIHPQLSACT